MLGRLDSICIGKRYYGNEEQALRALRKLDRQVRKRTAKLKKHTAHKYEDQ